jgi:uncharacterized RDD family membrane protein YckC
VSIAARRTRTRAAPAPPTAPPPVIDAPAGALAAARQHQYVGLVTRALAFAADAAVINAVAILTAAVVALTFSVVPVPKAEQTVAVALGGAIYVVWTVAYFATFWATTGQTPGSRLMRMKVRPTAGERLPPRRAVLRFVALMLAALPLFAGFLVILVDDRRRGLHDWIARTVVVDADDDEP